MIHCIVIVSFFVISSIHASQGTISEIRAAVEADRRDQAQLLQQYPQLVNNRIHREHNVHGEPQPDNCVKETFGCCLTVCAAVIIVCLPIERFVPGENNSSTQTTSR